MESSIVGYCSRTRQFGIGAVNAAFGGPSRRLAGRAWRGLVYAQGASGLKSVSHAESLLDLGWKGDALLDAVLQGDECAPQRQLATIDSNGRVIVRAGASVQRASCQHTAQHVGVTTIGLPSSASADRMLSAFQAAPSEPLAERLVKAVEAGYPAVEAKALSAFVRVYDPYLEDPYVDITVDLHDEPVAELRRIHDWMAPLYDYYAMKGLNPAVPRYTQWLAERGIRRT